MTVALPHHSTRTAPAVTLAILAMVAASATVSALQAGCAAQASKVSEIMPSVASTSRQKYTYWSRFRSTTPSRITPFAAMGNCVA
jgi:hypothetical protein